MIHLSLAYQVVISNRVLPDVTCTSTELAILDRLFVVNHTTQTSGDPQPVFNLTRPATHVELE